MLAMRNLYRVAEAGTCTFGQVGRQASIFGGMVMALHPPLKRKNNPQGPATSFIVACAFAPVGCALGYKGRSLVVGPHGDTQVNFLGTTAGRLSRIS